MAVYSDADRNALHVRLADYAYPIGAAPASESYLNVPAVLEAARRGHAYAGLEHLLFALLHDEATAATVSAAGADVERLKRRIDNFLQDEVKPASTAPRDSASPTLGVIGVDDGDLAEGTATVSYSPASGLMLRGEARADAGLGGFEPFLSSESGASAAQFTLTFGAVGEF